MLMAEVRAEQLVRNIDAGVRESLSPAQLAAIRDAARADNWNKHPIDLRVSLPSPFGRYYMALVAGRERRGGARRAAEQARHPFATNANIAFCVLFLILAAAAGVCLVALLGGMLTY